MTMRKLKLLIVPTLLALSLVTGCASDKSVVSQAANVHTELEPAVMDDPALANYLQRLGDRIIETTRVLNQQHNFAPENAKGKNNEWMFGKNMKFHFVNSDQLNAFTTGGEHMYIYTELFEKSRSEDELAAVMAHEYAHVFGRHVAKGMNRQYGALAAAAAAAAGGYALGGKEKGTEYATAGAGLGLAAGQFANMGFTRKDEAEADKLGFYIYSHAGWDPNKFDDFFQAMIDAGHDTSSAITSDHPTLKSRVEDTQRRIKELPPQASQWRKPPVATPQQFAELQQRAAKLGKSHASDKTLANSQTLLAALPRSCVMPIDPPQAVQAREKLVKDAQAAEAKQQQQQPPAK
jgi:predicted Zn-dependent protease